MKLTKRKGFNFFRSYYDVYNELDNSKDKLAFIDALLNKQFQGVDPVGLKGMAKFAWVSQINSIDSQVKGYETKTGLKLTPCQGGVNTPSPQVQVEVQVQVQGKGKEKGKRKKFTPPTLEEFMVYGKSCFDADEKYKQYRQQLINKHKAWEANNWHNDYQNKPIKIWKTTLLNTINAWITH